MSCYDLTMMHCAARGGWVAAKCLMGLPSMYSDDDT